MRLAAAFLMYVYRNYYIFGMKLCNGLEIVLNRPSMGSLNIKNLIHDYFKHIVLQCYYV